MEYSEIMKHCGSNNWDMLTEYDQLFTEMNKGKVLNGFSEGPLSFPPTYKYDVGTDKFDSRFDLCSPPLTAAKREEEEPGMVRQDSLQDNGHQAVQLQVRASADVGPQARLFRVPGEGKQWKVPIR